MEVCISTGVASVQATLSFKPTSDTWVLFLSGGSLAVGRERYIEWQEKLLEKGINSLCFDYSGVQASGVALQKSSLALRIGEAQAAVDYIKSKSEKPTITIFGSSMGGYIALGLAHSDAESIAKVVLYAPAAYAKAAHQLYFDGSFTAEIRREKSWEQSFSYQWFEEITAPILYIEPDTDLVVPEGVYKKYREIGSEKANFEILNFSGPHNCWDDNKYKDQRQVLLDKLFEFVGVHKKSQTK